jgi:hypothetical protein
VSKGLSRARRRRTRCSLLRLLLIADHEITERPSSGPEQAVRYPLRRPRLLVGLGQYLLRHRGGDVRIEDTAPPIRRGDGVRALTQVRGGEDGLSMAQVNESEALSPILEGDSPRGRSRSWNAGSDRGGEGDWLASLRRRSAALESNACAALVQQEC